MMNQTKRLTHITMLIAISILFHLIESMIPIPIMIPGFKLGLANIVGLIALYSYVAPGFWLSFSGVLLSSIAAILARKYSPMSIYGVSCASSACHVIGQVCAVSVLYHQFLMGALLPILLLLSIPTGLFTGMLAMQVLKRIQTER